MDQLTIEKEKVLKASKENPIAEPILKTLFPGAFSGAQVQLDDLTDGNVVITKTLELNRFMEVAHSICAIDMSNLKRKAFWLKPAYDWKLIKQTDGHTLLVPTIK